MSWELAGVLAEVVGAGAVVVTLVYLAVQIRLTREASQVQSSYTTLEIFGSWRAHLIASGDLAAAVSKADRGELLAPEEDLRVATLMEDLFLDLAISEASAARAHAFYARSAEIEYVRWIMRQHPGLCPYWGRCRGYIVVVAPDFAAAVDAVMADDEPAPSAGNDDAHATAG